ncbi:MAG: response regulator [Gemmatimonadetes bacterium]|nr:response regulator [Gemmatimonadota bacterium]
MTRRARHTPCGNDSGAAFRTVPSPENVPPQLGPTRAVTTSGPERPYGTAAPAGPLIPRKNDVLAEICRAIARNASHLDVVQDSAVRLQRYFGTHSITIFFGQDGDMVLAGLALPAHLEYLTDEVHAGFLRAPLDDQRPSVQAMRLRRIVRRDAADSTMPAATEELLRMGSAAGIIAVPIFADGEPISAYVVATPEERPLNAADECLLEDALGVVGIVYQRGMQREREVEHQRQALQAHNLAVVGELAAGVAHEINNPLSTIVHFSEILLDSGLVAEDRAHVRAILEEALRAAATVRNLQTFARQEVRSERASTRVDEATLAIADLEKHQLAVSNVDLRVDIPADLPAVRADAASLRLVLHNLIANARYAIHQTRRLGEIRMSAALDGVWVRITVEDTGIGLTPKVAEAMFQPFFTTKPTSEGTGLGLAVAYGMVREHGGEIEAENWGRPPALGGEPGAGGARVTVWLPADLERAAPSAPTVDAEGRPARARSILVVEDELHVARSVAALLMREGHRVTIVGTAEEAVEELSVEEPDFDVVLSDYRMPGTGGEGLFEWVRSTRPLWLERLVYMSGDLLSPRTQAFLEGAGRPVLAKPFTLAALRAALAPLAR